MVWRLASGRYDPPAGEGARVVGGRWNSPGGPVVYSSESVALCVVEALVHITGPFPLDYQMFEIDVPDAALEPLDSARLKRTWAEDLGYTRAIGDQWLRQGRSPALRVPSAVVPASANILINPLHPDAGAVRLVGRRPFRFDPRLRSESPS